MKVGQKIISGFLLAVLLIGIVGYFGIRTSNEMQKNFASEVKVSSFVLKVSEKGTVTFAATLTEDLKELIQLEEKANQLREEINVLNFDLLKDSDIKNSVSFQSFLKTKNDHDKDQEQVFRLHNELLTRQDLFGESHLVEEAVRQRLRVLLFRTNDLELIQGFWLMESYSKKALFQYQDAEHVDTWLLSIRKLRSDVLRKARQEKILLNQLTVYLQTAEIVGEITARESEIKAEEARIISIMRKSEVKLAELRRNIVDELLINTSRSFQNSRNALVVTIVATLALAVSIGLFISHSISAPIKRLTQTARDIAAGDLKKRVIVNTRDEIGQLATSFNKMITKLQEYYQNLEYEKNKLSHIAQNMEVGAILLDKQGEVVFLNRKAKDILGLTDNGEEDVLERFFTLFSAFNVKKHLNRCIEGESSRISRAEVDNKIFEIFFRNLIGHQDNEEGGHKEDIFGYLIWIHDITVSKLLERQIQKRAQELELNVVKLEKTKIAIQNLLEDLAEEKKKIEQRVMMRTTELEQEKSKLNQITQNMATGALLLDGQGKVIFVNKEANKILGLKDGDTGSALKKLYRTFKNVPVGEHVKKCLLGKPTKIPEIQVGDKIFEILFRCLSESTEHTTHFFGYLIWIEDITEEKLLERSRSELIAVASHQLRTPLTVTKGNTEMLLDEMFGPLNSEQRKLITQTAQANERLIRLVNNMLDLTKMEKGKLKMILEHVQIEEILESVVNDLRFYAKKHAALVQYIKPDEQVPVVMADKVRLRQVFQNLIENSIRYCISSREKTCSVKISVDVSDTHITVHISDTGIGIPEYEQSKIFGRFYRASNAVRHASTGSGLGLSTAQSITKQLGGKIWFESTENKGTTFHVALPIVKT